MKIHSTVEIEQIKLPLQAARRYEIFQDVVVFDLETTYSHPQEIIQIAGWRIYKCRVMAKGFHSYVNPGRRIDPSTTEYTRITNRQVRHAPTILEALPTFSRFCGDSVLVAHNGRQFDFRLIQNACDNAHWSMRGVRFVDSMHLSWALWGRVGVCHGLDAVASRLRVAMAETRRHDARYDAKVLAECFIKITRRLGRSQGNYEPRLYRGVLPADDNRVGGSGTEPTLISH